MNSTKIKDLIKLGLRNPVSVNLQVESKNTGIDQSSLKGNEVAIPDSLKNYYVTCQRRTEKFCKLINFLITIKHLKTIVFFNTCNSVDYYYKLISTLPALKGKNRFLKKYNVLLNRCTCYAYAWSTETEKKK